MRLKTPTDIIIIDPYNIAIDDDDWGPGEIFDWETYKINSNIFTEYLWGDCSSDGIVYEVNRKINESVLNDMIGALKITNEDIEDFRDKLLVVSESLF